MKKNLRPTDILKNEKGILTVDYLLSMVMIMGFTVILFSISVTLTVVEVTQYATYAASRAFFAGHLDFQEQRNLGEAKLNEIIGHPVIKTFYENGWFEISQIEVSEVAGVQLGYDGGNSQVNSYQGARLQLKANMLDFEIPGYGSTSSSDAGTDDGFLTYVQSYLSREPTFRECQSFNNRRWEAIKNLDVPGGVAGYDTAPTGARAALAIHDNGC